jgi:CBS domain-containing protein
LKKVTYGELFSGRVELSGKSIKTAPLSSLRISFEILAELEKWINEGSFSFQEDVVSLRRDTKPNALKLKRASSLVSKAMTSKLITAKEGDSLEKVSKLMVEKDVDQIPVIGGDGKVKGIVTSLDFTRATAKKKNRLEDVMSKKVVVSKPDDSIEEVSRRLQRHGFNSTPVVDDKGKIIGIITLSDINRALRRSQR